MNFYERWILPSILDLIMRRKDLTKYRRAVVASARGRVLEIGVGNVVAHDDYASAESTFALVVGFLILFTSA
jgi:hypothetical protein